MRLVLKTCVLSSLLGAMLGCGAPTKSAAQVADLFEGTGTTLQDKETTLCGDLASASSAPTTQGMSIDLSGCKQAGEAAVNYKQVSQFYFMGLTDTPAGTGQDQVFHKAVRAQVWLNKSLLDLASSLGSMLKNGQGLGSANTGAVSLPDSSGGGFGGLVTPTITITEQPKFDTANMAFSMKLNFKLTGAITADHDIAIDGKLINNAIAVTVKTVADRTFQQSILKNFQAVVLLIPHAGDVYLDLFVDVNIYNFGLDQLVHDQVNQFLTTGLKSLIDKAMQL